MSLEQLSILAGFGLAVVFDPYSERVVIEADPLAGYYFSLNEQKVVSGDFSASLDHRSAS